MHLWKQKTASKGSRIFFPYIVTGMLLLLVIPGIYWGVTRYMQKQRDYAVNISKLESENLELQKKVENTAAEIESILKQDQRVRNDLLEKDIISIEKTYNDAMETYEEILKLKDQNAKTAKLDSLFVTILSQLSKREYVTASATLKVLTADIAKAREDVAAKFVIPVSVPVLNTVPQGGYSRQTVASDLGNFLVDIVAGDLSSTRVLVDSASDSDCANDCPVLPLGEYVSRNGGYAGINGSYFCPATYPSCQDKKNSFDTLLMNKNKKYLNSDNNVYSVIPAVIFQGSSVRFVSRSLEWGRDTGVDGVLANHPLLLAGGNIAFTGDGDPKKGSKGSRSFVANKGSTVYIGVIHNATVAEGAHVLKTMGMDNALNLDSGGSTALYYGGYKAGPGRNIPNAIVFVRK